MSEQLSIYTEVKNYLSKKYLFRYNEISNLIEYSSKFKKSAYKDLNENNLICEMNEEGVKCKEVILSQILGSDYVPHYNPIQEYFETLPPYKSLKKQHPDLIYFLSTFVKILNKPEGNQQRFAEQFKKALVRSVACALKDGYINKHLIVFISPQQNIGKTFFCRYLCPPPLNDYKTEIIANDKDGQIALTENFMIIMDELSNLNKVDMETFKTSISKDYVKVRPPFGKRAVRKKRICTFWGNTNRREFLTDVTGNIRWLSFEIKWIDFNYTKININHIYAQAYELYKSGFKYDLTNEEIHKNEEFNETHFVYTIEMELIEAHYYPSTIEEITKTEPISLEEQKGGLIKFLTSTEIMENLMNHHPNIKINHLKSIGMALQKLGFSQISRFIDKHRGSRKGYWVTER